MDGAKAGDQQAANAMNLATRKRLAAPLYWLAGVFLTWANRVDGPQPRKRK